MDYPEPTYFGDSGEVSATYRPANQAPELTYPTGNTAHYLATGESTGGLFGLYRWVMGPEPSGPGPHFHRSIAESFYVLTGSVRFTDGTRWIDTGPGDYLHVSIGGDPRVPQRVRRTGLDADPLRAGRIARGLLRRPRRVRGLGDARSRRAPGVLPRARQRLARRERTGTPVGARKTSAGQADRQEGVSSAVSSSSATISISRPSWKVPSGPRS
jgi:mannose-6-phosphate isomerase-like protein (cupin superfamily)